MGPASEATTANDWQGPARRALLGLRSGASGWGYRIGTAPGVEPTALAGLGLLAAGRGVRPEEGGAAVTAAADWLAAIQQRDGSLGVSERLPTPGWTTAYALLLWKALGGYEPRRRRAASWLLRQKGTIVPAGADPDRVLGHDTTLVGWPWVDGTHSWLEPTVLAVLALRREGLGAHPRVSEGLRVILDRAVATGGWNCGNKSAFGRVLRAQPAPTGLALLALAPDRERSEVVGRAIRYLLAHLPGVRAAESLGWGLLGLRAWRELPEGAGRWLDESYRRTVARSDAAPRLSLLLLAAGAHALELFDGKSPED
jgi:hypothetical protein